MLRRDLTIQVPVQAPQFGEIGAGIELGPNACTACDSPAWAILRSPGAVHAAVTVMAAH